MKNKIVLTDFKDNFAKRLKENPKELRDFKKYVLSEFSRDQNKELLLEGLKTIAMASEGIYNLSKKTHLSRRNLYKIFTKEGNPTLNTFFEILKSLNMKLKIADF